MENFNARKQLSDLEEQKTQNNMLNKSVTSSEIASNQKPQAFL